MSSGPYHHILPSVLPFIENGELFTDKSVKAQATRYAYAEALLELGETHPQVVVLNADVSKSLNTNRFAAKYPEREFNFGIAEQNLVAAAAGMATTGLIPFVSGYAMFLSLRALDQVRNSVHYPHLNVKIGASHSGLTPGPDGVTHQAQEDLSLMRAIGGSCVIAPADAPSAILATLAAADYVGPVYLSFTRDPVPVLFDRSEYPFEIGKMVLLRDGVDATIIANRDLVAQALLAAAELAQEGLQVRVLDAHTIKPLDEAAVLQAAEETGAIVTAEDNVIFGGLGSAVAEVLVENHPIPMQRIGMRDGFAESGPYLAVIDRYGMTARHIARAVRKVIARKQGK